MARAPINRENWRLVHSSEPQRSLAFVSVIPIEKPTIENHARRIWEMAFPPNYRQERSNRERAKQRKALEKQQKRMEKSGLRKETDEEPAPGDAAPDSAESVKE
jgi:hypothetical protein